MSGLPQNYNILKAQAFLKKKENYTIFLNHGSYVKAFYLNDTRQNNFHCIFKNSLETI